MQPRESLRLYIDIFWIWDCSEKKFSFISTDTQDILGLDTSSLLSNPLLLLDVVEESDRPSLQEIISHSESQTNSISFQHLNGRRFSASWAIGPDQTMLGSLSDISSEYETSKMMVQYVEKSDAILQAAISPYALINVDGFITNFNTAFASLMGMTLSDMQGQHICTFSSDPVQFQKELIDQVLESGDVRFESNFIRPDAQTIPVECSATSVAMHDRTMIVAFFNDISIRVEAKEHLSDALRQKEEAMRLKQQLMANVTHEIKSPISTILGLVKLLETHTPPNSEQSEYLDMIQFNSNRLMSSLQYVIEISRLESGLAGTAFKRVNLASSLLDLIPNFEKQLEGKQVLLDTNLSVDNLEIEGDHYLLQETWRILVGNAIKFTHEGKIAIHLEKNEDENDIELTICDSGVGIGADYLKSVFQPFSQENGGNDRPFQGMGLGLTLAKRYVELQKGVLEIESVKGSGTKVIVRFPSLN